MKVYKTIIVRKINFFFFYHGNKRIISQNYLQLALRIRSPVNCQTGSLENSKLGHVNEAQFGTSMDLVWASKHLSFPCTLILRGPNGG